MTGGPEQSAGEERGDARLRAGRVRWQVGPERALRGEVAKRAGRKSLGFAGWAAAALGPSWVGFGLHIGFGFLVLGWAGLSFGFGLWVPFLFLFTLSFLFLTQTKYEFKFKFEFKPHSNH